jgi:hypothetical protein
MKATRFPTTYAFRARAGGIGVLQIISYDEEAKTARIRYKLARSEAARTPAVAKPAVGVVLPAFGPVMERVLPQDVPCRQQHFQFHNGEVYVVGNGPGTPQEEAALDEQRIEDAGGADMSAISGDEGIQISGRGCFFTRDVDGLEWDRFTAGEAVEAVKRVRFVNGVVSPKLSELPMTYLFKTARGEVGIMEVLGAVDEARPNGVGKGMKFRYKLVQGAGPGELVKQMTQSAPPAASTPAAIADPLPAIELNVAQKQLEKVLDELMETQAALASEGERYRKGHPVMMKLESKRKLLEEQSARLREVIRQSAPKTEAPNTKTNNPSNGH